MSNLYDVYTPIEPSEIGTKGSLYKIPDSWYFDGPGLSKSKLDLIHKAPSKFECGYEHQDSKEMGIGRLFHSMVLEPETLDRKYIRAPKINRRTKAGKEEWQEFMDFAQFKEVVADDDWATAEGMTETLCSSETYDNFIKGGLNEISVYANLVDDVLSRGRIDVINNDSYLIDLKTTKDITYGSFRNSVENFRYYVQAAYYLDLMTEATGIPHDTFLIIAIERENPFLFKSYVLSPEYIEIGRMEYLQDLHVYKECLAKNDWPGMDQSIELLEPPKWRNK